MEEKKKGVLRFFKLSAGRHKREAAPGTPAQAVKGRKGRKKWVKPLVILLIIGAAAAAAMTFRGHEGKGSHCPGTVPQYGIGGAQGHFLRAVFLRNP